MDFHEIASTLSHSVEKWEISSDSLQNARTVETAEIRSCATYLEGHIEFIFVHITKKI